jgi:hypothetical protein
MRTYQSQDDGLDPFDANTTPASMKISATTASPHACSGCLTARGSVLTNNAAKLNGPKGRIEIASRMPAQGADQCR